MDLATIVGFAIGFGMIVLGLVVSHADLRLYWDLPSVFITIGGSFGALMISNPLGRTLAMLKYAVLVIRTRAWEEEKIITMLVTFSEKARREGLLALEDDLGEVEDEFLRKGIQLVVDGTDPEIIKTVLYNELNQIQSRHNAVIKLFSDWGKLAPAFGMIGTLTGLILMLANMDDKDSIGTGMAQALITTLYGAILANLVFIPIGNKLAEQDGNEMMVKELMVEGILSIQSGDNPRILEEKLIAFLQPKQREAIKQEIGKE